MKSWKSCLATWGVVSLTAASLALSACAPIARKLDNPLDGAAVELQVDQPLEVRLSSNATTGGWVDESVAPTSVKVIDHASEVSGGQGSKSFSFLAVKPGSDQLRFVYRDGAQANAVSDMITVNVSVR